MSIIDIQPATRAGAHLLIQFFGGPRSGKTFSALILARGIVGPNGKIGVLCTESGRARLYCDKVPGGYFVGELQPPFTPDRYKLAITEFIKFGVDILVIDSFSHIWEGEGGILEQADKAEAAGAKGLLKWKHKAKYKSVVNSLLSMKVHLIFCSRAKQPIREVTNAQGRKEFVKDPWEPIQDKNLKYEMTIVLPMTQDGAYETAPDRLKAPGDLLPLFDGKPVTTKIGEAIGAWIGGVKPVNHEAELLNLQADEAAGQGLVAYQAFFAGLTNERRKLIQGRHEDRKSRAKAADEERAEQERLAREAATNLEDPFGTQEPGPAVTVQPAAPTPGTLDIASLPQAWQDEVESLATDLAKRDTLGKYRAFADDNAKRIDAMPPGVRAVWDAHAKAHVERITGQQL